MVTQSSVPSPALSPPARRKQLNRAPNEPSPKCSQSQIRSSCGWKFLHLHLKHNKDTMLNGCLNMMIGKHGLVNIKSRPSVSYALCVGIPISFTVWKSGEGSLRALIYTTWFIQKHSDADEIFNESNKNKTVQILVAIVAAWLYDLTTLWPTYTDKHELKIINW